MAEVNSPNVPEGGAESVGSGDQTGLVPPEISETGFKDPKEKLFEQLLSKELSLRERNESMVTILGEGEHQVLILHEPFIEKIANKRDVFIKTIDRSDIQDEKILKAVEQIQKDSATKAVPSAFGDSVLDDGRRVTLEESRVSITQTNAKVTDIYENMVFVSPKTGPMMVKHLWGTEEYGESTLKREHSVPNLRSAARETDISKIKEGEVMTTFRGISVGMGTDNKETIQIQSGGSDSFRSIYHLSNRISDFSPISDGDLAIVIKKGIEHKEVYKEAPVVESFSESLSILENLGDEDGLIPPIV